VLAFVQQRPRVAVAEPVDQLALRRGERGLGVPSGVFARGELDREGIDALVAGGRLLEGGGRARGRAVRPVAYSQQKHPPA
jgi:hypothetical protein